MSNKQIFKCPCGQETHLVESREGLRYDEKKHGNDELCSGLCFNCRKPLAELEDKEAQAVDEVVDETADETDLEAMSWLELKKLAKEAGLDVPTIISKVDLIKMITEADNAETGEDDPED